MKTAVFFVGNRLMLDDGAGPAAYDDFLELYSTPEGVDLFDVGCMSLDMLPKVQEYDFLMTVDAIDGTGAEPGTVFRYKPEDMARNTSVISSLHETRLADLFDAALLLGYEADGLCYGIQVENMEPADFIEGLTPKVAAGLPLLVDSVAAELTRKGYEVARRK